MTSFVQINYINGYVYTYMCLLNLFMPSSVYSRRGKFYSQVESYPVCTLDATNELHDIIYVVTLSSVNIIF